MGAFITHLDSSGHNSLWLDYVDYAGGLLAGGKVPWLDAIAAVAWLRKAQRLLGSDVVALPVRAVYAAWLTANATLRAAMGARQRAVFPLKTLLADEGSRAHLVALMQALRGTFASVPLVLICASPRYWLAEAYRQAFGPDAAIEVDDEVADSAALYIADFLRTFGDSGVDALLLEESALSEPARATDLACYQSALNVASHYRWDAGLHVQGTRFVGGEAGLAFVIAPQPLPGARAGVTVPSGFWNGEPPPACPAGGFRFARIPSRADPERVLERLAVLR